MIGDFLQYIVALLIYATYQPPEGGAEGDGWRAAFWLAILSGLFVLLTRRRFHRLERRIFGIDQGLAPLPALGDECRPAHVFQGGDAATVFQKTVFRQSLLALGLYAVDIHFLHASRFFSRIPLLEWIPTLGALAAFLLFFAYLTVIWARAHRLYVKIHRHPVSRLDYVWSHITFAIPVILPWLVLSLVTDLINLSPFDLPREVLSSSEGQMAYFMFFLVAIALTGPLLIQRFWGCRPLPPGPARRRIEEMCAAADMPYRDILVWPLFGGHMITAGVMGLVRRFRYILVTPALLRYLDPLEMDAVISHEIGHIKQRHLIWYLVFFCGYLTLSFLTTQGLAYGLFYADTVWGGPRQKGGLDASLTSISFSLTTIGLFLIYFRYLFGYFMRNFERQADGFAFVSVGFAGPLISTFEKITRATGVSPDKPDWHHFSIRERIAFLLACESDPSLICRHSRRIHRHLMLYLLGLALAAWGGWAIHYGGVGEAVLCKALETVFLQEMETDRHNPDLYQALGDVYFSGEQFEKSIEAYETALQLAPDHVQAQNNLAWLYATAPAAFQNPERALALAKRAAALSPTAQVLDTLAESYFVNNDSASAIAFAKQALAAAQENRSYYEAQLKKFEKARPLVTGR